MAFFKRNPFRTTYFLPTAAKSKQKVPLATKVLNRKKGLFYGANRVVATNVSLQLPLKWHPARRPHAICS
jgi:hypothetical protein